MALQDTDLFIVQRAAQSYKMQASELSSLVGVNPSPDEPGSPEAGDLWFDTVNNILFYYDGTNWQPITPETPGTDEPDSPTAGQLWYDTSVQALKCYVGGQWVWAIKGAESGATNPASGLEGQLFYNTTNDQLLVYKNGDWAVTGGGASVEVGDTLPSGASQGDLWWKSDEGVLYIFYEDIGGTSQWVQAAGGGGSGSGASVTVADVAPTGASDGDLWYSSTHGRLFIYYEDADSSQWVDASPAGGYDGGVINHPITSPEKEITSTWDISEGNFWTAGAIVIPNPTNAVGGSTGTIRFTATPTGWGSNFKFVGGSTITPIAPAIVAFYVQDADTVLVANVLNSYS